MIVDNISSARESTLGQAEDYWPMFTCCGAANSQRSSQASISSAKSNSWQLIIEENKADGPNH